MTRTVVVNIKEGQGYDIFIGRGSPYGNPFSHVKSAYNTIKVASRQEAISRFREWIETPEIVLVNWPKPSSDMLRALRGKRLGCFCAPQPCHGDVLIELAYR